MPLTVITAAQLVQKMQEGELQWPPFFYPTTGKIYALSVLWDNEGHYVVYQV